MTIRKERIISQFQSFWTNRLGIIYRSGNFIFLICRYSFKKRNFSEFLSFLCHFRRMNETLDIYFLKTIEDFFQIYRNFVLSSFLSPMYLRGILHYTSHLIVKCSLKNSLKWNNGHLQKKKKNCISFLCCCCCCSQLCWLRILVFFPSPSVTHIYIYILSFFGNNKFTIIDWNNVNWFKAQE